jgi:hypothetical protein
MQPISEKGFRIFVSLYVMAIGLLACKPVFAIGWNELLFMAVLFVFLLGPPLYRLVRRVEDFLKRKDRNR